MFKSPYRWLLLLGFVASLCLSTRPASAAGSLTVLEFPRTVRADAFLASVIEEMLVLSPTFREQCRRLDAAERVVVVLRMNPLIPKGRFRATSTLKRYSSGLLVVDVEVAPGADQAEWVAHEFEHVLELLDGSNLPHLARTEAKGVWQSVDGMIETSRATEAGRSVLDETRGVDASDKFVE
jgi:hypothetical protein